MNAKNMNKGYLTPKQVADLLMVSPAAVRLWAKKGDLNALITPGGHRRFLHNEIERFAQVRGLTLNPSGDGDWRILIVDDDEQLLRYLEKLLNGLSGKITVETANSGFVAGLKVLEFQPHIVLLDLMMPGLKGFEVCWLIKSRPKTKAIRVIAMTGYYTPENVERIIKAGAENCLAKPIDVPNLFNVLGLPHSIPETEG